MPGLGALMHMCAGQEKRRLMQFLLLQILGSRMVSAHTTSNNNEGCCGDIPESLIWTLSFFVLIGILVVVSSYFFYPLLPTDRNNNVITGGDGVCNSAPTPAMNIRINKNDIERIARAVAKYTNKNSNNADKGGYYTGDADPRHVSSSSSLL